MHLKKQCRILLFCETNIFDPPAVAAGAPTVKTAGELLVEGRRQGQT